MYVCGPTVYDRPHLGNARAVVVYDILYRILKLVYGEVLYARNITDVDDKINKAAKENGESISVLTKRITQYFHQDMAQLGNLPPTIEPKATEHIEDIITLIEKIIANGYAYIEQGHVIFDVAKLSSPQELPHELLQELPQELPSANQGEKPYYYGILSKKKLQDLQTGARIATESYKKSALDFVLWKPASNADDASSIFASPWGNGRPGWHIECSAMSTKHLGENFDIHGGGADLKFPHHENEIAQARCANHASSYANYWVHNGFLTIEGEKMSKSLGNFTTVRQALEQGIPGEAIRLAMLKTHYRKPFDYTQKIVQEATTQIEKFYHKLAEFNRQQDQNKQGDNQNSSDKSTKLEASIETATKTNMAITASNLNQDFVTALLDDMNLPKALSILYKEKNGEQLKAGLNFLGLCNESPEEYFAKKKQAILDKHKLTEQEIQAMLTTREVAKQQQDWHKADEIRNKLANYNITIKDGKDGTTWHIQ
jgi:cysteinyl-tRNA synthetase